MKPYFIAGIVSLAAVLGSTGAVFSSDIAAETQIKTYSNVKLLAGNGENAGLEIDLDPGWKTYWRVPGEAGVPPSIVFDGSENLAKAEISWPAPQRFKDIYGESIGYKEKVIFPLKVTPKDPQLPVKLKVELFYAVCSDICIPVRKEVSTVVNDGKANNLNQYLIRRFAEKVPAEDAYPGIKVTDIRTEKNASGDVLRFRLSGDIDAKELDIFVEGYELAYFNRPVDVAGGDATVRDYQIKVDGLEDITMLRGTELTMTFVTGKAGFVRRVTVQ